MIRQLPAQHTQHLSQPFNDIINLQPENINEDPQKDAF